MKYLSTRNSSIKVEASQAILKGLSDDGGLFVPEEMPVLKKSLKELSAMSYREIAYEVMSLFLTDYTEKELKDCINAAYDEKFESPDIAELHKADGSWFLELWHGKTIAFKDMALSILPHLLTTAAKKNNIKDEIVILTATSGDTGKAALAGFADVPGTRIIVFYPKDGVSRVQELQMVTQKGKNTKVIAIKGNFDDAQNGVKEMFNDKELAEKLSAKGLRFSSANSINIGRLVPQIVYYVWAYAKLLEKGEVKEGQKINITVPTGNFGNILAAYYAKNIGLPVNKLICASNDNKVLYDFFKTGTYDRNREFILTTSPSMDILISSNLERLIYHSAGNDAKKCGELMKELKETGKYTVTDAMRKNTSDFTGGFATQKEVSEVIDKIHKKDGYTIDTHTAVGAFVTEKYKEETGDDTLTVIASTASPYKFSRAVVGAINEKDYKDEDDLVLIDMLRKASGLPVPGAIKEIRDAEILHKSVCERNKMKFEVEKTLGL